METFIVVYITIAAIAFPFTLVIAIAAGLYLESSHAMNFRLLDELEKAHAGWKEAMSRIL